MGDSYENGFCWLRCLVIHIQYTPFCTVNNLFMEGKRWRRPCNQSMARLWWIKSNTMTDLLSCWSIHSILHSLSPSLSTFISLHLWLSDLSSPNFWNSLYLSSLWTFQEYGGTWGPAHTPCKCCCERRISGWRNRGRERDRREGGNMWEGASHMDTGCCQARGRETVLSLSLAYTHTHSHSLRLPGAFWEFYQPGWRGTWRKLLWTLPAWRQKTDIHRNKAGWNVSTMCYCVLNLVNLWLYELMLESCNG